MLTLSRALIGPLVLALLAGAVVPAALAQDAPPPVSPSEAEDASPQDPLAEVKAEATRLEEAAVTVRQASEQLLGGLLLEEDALKLRLESADADAKPAVEARLERVRTRIRLARERTATAAAAAAAAKQLVLVLEARQRRATEGPGALGIVVPDGPAEIDAALAALQADQDALPAKDQSEKTANAEEGSRRDAKAAAAKEVEVARAARDGIPTDDPRHAEADAELQLRNDELKTQSLRLVQAGVVARLESARHQEALAIVGLRRSAIEQADPAEVEAARARAKDAQASAELEAAERRRLAEAAAITELQAVRDAAQRKLNEAADQILLQTSPAAQRVSILNRDNAQRTLSLADVEEQLRQVEATAEKAAADWAAEQLTLDDQRARAAAGGLSVAAIEAHVTDVRARLAALSDDELEAHEAREALALQNADQRAQERSRFEQELAAADQRGVGADVMLFAQTRSALVEAATLLASLRDGWRKIAWAYDRLTEIQQARAEAYEATLVDPAMQIRYYGNTRRQWIEAAAIVGATVVLSLLASMLLRLLLLFARRTQYTLDELAVQKLRGPLRLALYLTGAELLLRLMTLPERGAALGRSGLSALWVIAIVYAAYNLVDVVRHALQPIIDRTESKLDDQLLPLLSRIAKVLVIVIGFCEVAAAFGYNVTSVLAGVGVGGIAIALAAKDTVSNLFGSIMIFTDKPFEVGNWIRLPDCEGIVEEIGLRSTKVRTWEDTLITIPNQKIGNATIENVSRFNARRVLMNVGMRYDTPIAKIEPAVEQIRALLVEHPDIRSGHYVFFNDLKDCSLNVMVYYFVKFTTWREYLTIRQEVTLKIMALFESMDIGFAFPTQTVELEAQLPGAPPLPAGSAPTPTPSA